MGFLVVPGEAGATKDVLRIMNYAESHALWTVKLYDGFSNQEFQRRGSYEQVANSLTGCPPAYIWSISGEPVHFLDCKEPR